MDNKKYQVFISSTYKDLIDARRKVQDTILSMYHFPIGMEMFSANDDEQWDVIKDTIESTDYYIVIIGHRYGSEAPDGIGYTEKEYDYAKELGIPILAFIRNRNVSLRQEEMDIEQVKIKKLNDFIDKASKSKMCDYWSNFDELASKVSVALIKQFGRKPRPGWIRADNIDFTKISNELMVLNNENRQLRVENENLKYKLDAKKPKVTLQLNDGEEIVIEYLRENNHLINRIEKIYYEDISILLKEYTTKEEVDLYNAELPPQQELDKYNSELEAYWRMKNSGKILAMKVSNNGTAIANNIYIDLKFPKEIRVIEPDDIEIMKEPKQLDLPENPIKKAERIYAKRLVPYSDTLNNLMNMGIVAPKVYNINSFPTLQRTRNSWVEDNTITISLDSLMHKREIDIDEIYKIVPLQIGTFEIDISIICEEYDDSIDYKVPISVKEL